MNIARLFFHAVLPAILLFDPCAAEGQLTRLGEFTVNTATIGLRTRSLIRAENIDGQPSGTCRFGQLVTIQPHAPLSACFERRA